ncbi:M48 family metalloprotease [Sphingomonas sp. SUN039]|uniref:M48 family metalloprotease n=1 Tax=Sphingomonas sp. SUN039 TaxID=2937787 RepID=UPI0021644137|nr:M48 family metalloprotease [Sphingomonas sp. SUN039]UVO52875.1 M48 family metalloprotease [Sphingomonas sp. SUN039]
MFAIALALVLTPQQAAIRALADQDMRVATVGTRLAQGAAAMCPGQHLSTAGLVIQDAAQYSAATRDDARSALMLGEGPTVVGVVEGAGLAARIGDVVVAVDGATVAARPRAGAYDRVAQVEDAIEGATAPKVALDIRRGGASLPIDLAVVAGCRSRFQIVQGGLDKTQADGRYVQISERMLSLAPTDDALAAIMAHELAHNILRHAALKTPSKLAEYEADRLSVWLVGRAGYDLGAVMPFWEALKKRSDYGIFSDGTHPGWKNRLAAIAATLAEVRAQKAAGAPLVPSPQEDASQPPKAR